eukprot:8337790-Pyramimonas_sp.AAC.1
MRMVDECRVVLAPRADPHLVIVLAENKGGSALAPRCQRTMDREENSFRNRWQLIMCIDEGSR